MPIIGVVPWLYPVERELSSVGSTVSRMGYGVWTERTRELDGIF